MALFSMLLEPLFAVLSANTLPSYPLCAGFHLRVTSLVLPSVLRVLVAERVVLLLITV